MLTGWLPGFIKNNLASDSSGPRLFSFPPERQTRFIAPGAQVNLGQLFHASAITAIWEIFEETGALIGQDVGPKSPYLAPTQLVANRQALQNLKMTFLDMIKALGIKLDLRQIRSFFSRVQPTHSLLLEILKAPVAPRRPHSFAALH